MAQEVAGGTAVLERDGPHDAGGAGAHWPSAGPPMSVATAPGEITVVRML